MAQDRTKLLDRELVIVNGTANWVEEFEDHQGGKRVRVKCEENGRKQYSSTQGYSHMDDAIKAAVRTSRALLKKYGDSFPE
jgi:hypothetical protein